MDELTKTLDSWIYRNSGLTCTTESWVNVVMGDFVLPVDYFQRLQQNRKLGVVLVDHVFMK